MKNLRKVLRSIVLRLQEKEGFTLVELLIVISILAILGGFAFTQFSGILDDTKVSTARSKMKGFTLPLERYNLRYNTYPSTEEGLEKLADEGFIKKTKDALLDPWNTPYQYRYPGEFTSEPEIWSLGADKKEGGEGKDADIKSWE